MCTEALCVLGEALCELGRRRLPGRDRPALYLPQRGVQWKRGVVICMLLWTSLLYNTTPINCTPLRLHPPVMNIQAHMLRAHPEGRTVLLLLLLLLSL